MKAAVFASFLAVPFTSAGLITRRDPQIPLQGKAPNTFNHGTKMQPGQPPQTTKPLPGIYQPRDIDIPFGRLSHGKIMYFRPGEMNTKDGVSDTGVGIYDDAKQSACGIPDNAYSNSKVAIHPYWLKYAGLDRKLAISSHYNSSAAGKLTEVHRPLLARRLRCVLDRDRQCRHDLQSH